MFFTKTKPPEPEVIEHFDIPSEQYQQLAKKLGVATPEISQTKLRQELVELGCRIYDPAKVARWLTKQYGPARERGASWTWRPLRTWDTANPATWGMLSMPRTNNEISSGLNPYTKPIPYPVLLTVEKVTEKFPQARFFVSDEVRAEDRIQDPFLLTLIDNVSYIIERWDEPGYRE